MSQPSSSQLNLSSYIFSRDNPLKSLVVRLKPASAVAIATIKQLGQQVQGFSSRERSEPTQELDALLEDDLLSHSLLNIDPAESARVAKELDSCAELYEGEPIKEAVTLLAANFLGGGLITGGKGKFELDGFQSLPNYATWKWLIKEIYDSTKHLEFSEKVVLQQLLTSLDKLIEYSQDIKQLTDSNAPEEILYNTALKYAQRVQNLKIGESETFTSYWTNIGGGGGHALMYEITRNAEGNFDLLFFTSTGFQLTDVFLTENKTRLRPYVRYSNIPEHHLLFNKDGVTRPGFIQGFMELSVLAKKDSSRQVDVENVLQLLDYIEAYRVPVHIEECGAITGQRAGTCVPSVTKAWLRYKCGHLGFYKQFLFHVKLKLLSASYHSLANTLDKDAVNRRLLEQLSRKLLRRCAKLSDGTHGFGALINDDLLKQARATAHEIILRVAGATKADDRRTEYSVLYASDLSSLDVAQQRLARSQLFAIEPTIFPVSNAKPSVTLNLSIKLNTEHNCAASLKECLKATLSSIRANLAQNMQIKENAILLNMQLQLLVDQIPLPSLGNSSRKMIVDNFDIPFWANFSLQDLITVHGDLHKLTILYLQSNNFQNDLLTRQFATMLPLHVLSHFLALKIDAKKHAGKAANGMHLLESYKIPSFEDVLLLESVQFLDRKEFERVQIASQYFGEFNRRTKLGMLFVSEETTTIEKLDIKSNPQNGPYWQALLQTDAGLLAYINQLAAQTFPDLTEAQIEADYQAAKTSNSNLLQRQLADYQINLRAYENYQDSLRRGVSSPYPSYHPGPKPVLLTPYRKVNLPLLTKQMLIMQGLNGDTIEPMAPLEVNGYQHISILRRMSCLARHFFYDNRYAAHPWNNLMTATANRSSPYDYHGTVSNGRWLNPVIKPSPAIFTSLSAMHRPLVKAHTDFLALSATHRKETEQQQDIAEAYALREFPQKESLLHRILRTLSQWELTPNQLIYELAKEIKELQNPSLQGLLLRLFFKSPIVGSKQLELGAGNLILRDQALFENARSFIDKGLTYLLDSDEDLSAGKFFFELSFYLSKYLVDAGQQEKGNRFNLTQEIKRWFDKKGLTTEDKSMLHLYRVLFYSLKEDLSAEEKANLFASWAQYNLYPNGDNKWASPFLVDYAAHAMQRLVALTFSTSSPEELSQLGLRVFTELNLEPSNVNKWNIDPILKQPYLTNGKWKLQLARGAIHSELGEMKGLAKDFPWEKQIEFMHLFLKKAVLPIAY